MTKTLLRWALTALLLAFVWGGAWWSAPLAITALATLLELHAFEIARQKYWMQCAFPADLRRKS